MQTTKRTIKAIELGIFGALVLAVILWRGINPLLLLAGIVVVVGLNRHVVARTVTPR